MTTDTAAATVDRETGLELYRVMQECRLLETRAQELFFDGLVRGTTHLGVGQELVEEGATGLLVPPVLAWHVISGRRETRTQQQ